MEYKSEIDLAQKIVRRNFINFSSKENFIEFSAVYRWTNEDISSYFNYLKNKENILTVIGSGNQVLNSILAGSSNIDCFDISIFPKYYLYLHLASIVSLDKEEYVKFFLSDDRDEIFNYDIYEKFSSNLKGIYKQFWDSLYNFNDEFDIFNSLLFRQDFYKLKSVINYNPYLQDNNYNKLQQILKYSYINLNNYVCDISNYSFDKSYDLINLSNILFYVFKSMDEIVDFLKNNFLLNKNGIILNYCNHLDDINIKQYMNLVGNKGYIDNIDEHKLLILKK